MALFQAPLLTDGATHPAQQFRMMIRDLARGSEGITEGDDLKVTALSTPGAAVQVGDGSGTVRGRANAFQGSYSVCNIGAAQVPIAATGASTRSDMIVLRVEDPSYEGSRNPATDPIMYFEVIPGVSSTATTVPGGRTAIPLARIDIPANTSTITSGMITDLRRVANPRRDRSLYTQSPSSASTNITGTSGTFTNFSTAPGWSIAVPEWATTAKIRIDVAQISFSVGAFYGYLRATFGSSLTVQQVTLDDNQGTAWRRSTVAAADTLTVPASYRGTTQTLRVQAAGRSGNLGAVTVDASTTLIADVEFFEAAR